MSEASYLWVSIGCWFLLAATLLKRIRWAEFLPIFLIGVAVFGWIDYHLVGVLVVLIAYPLLMREMGASGSKEKIAFYALWCMAVALFDWLSSFFGWGYSLLFFAGLIILPGYGFHPYFRDLALTMPFKRASFLLVLLWAAGTRLVHLYAVNDWGGHGWIAVSFGFFAIVFLMQKDLRHWFAYLLLVTGNGLNFLSLSGLVAPAWNTLWTLQFISTVVIAICLNRLIDQNGSQKVMDLVGKGSKVHLALVLLTLAPCVLVTARSGELGRHITQLDAWQVPICALGFLGWIGGVVGFFSLFCLEKVPQSFPKSAHDTIQHPDDSLAQAVD